MLSCGDQLPGPCQLESLGSTVPQTSVPPDTLNSICMQVGQACLQRCILGYVSLDLASFVDPNTMTQKVRRSSHVTKIMVFWIMVLQHVVPNLCKGINF